MSAPIDHEQRLRKIKRLLESIAPHGELEGLRAQNGELEGLETVSGPAPEYVALEHLRHGRLDRIGPSGLEGLEAIILPDIRPVAFVRHGRFDEIGEPWSRLNTDGTVERFSMLMASVGRIDLPTSSIPYGGTGFVVGKDLLMTNRHVARLFMDGVGLRRLSFTPGDAEVDFLHEEGNVERALMDVTGVLMVHPYWDMAVLRVDGLPPDRPPLALDVRPVDELSGMEVAAVGYPARDPRNNTKVQDQVFKGIFNVKRFQPGVVRPRRRVRSFGNDVLAMTHDSSTLGGNSGSAVFDLATGHVVGLHFAGSYLDTNFAVPTYELARDEVVTRTGLNFVGSVAPSNYCRRAWTGADFVDEERPAGVPPAAPIQASTSTMSAQSRTRLTLSVPVQVTIKVGTPLLASDPQDTVATLDGLKAPTPSSEAWPMRRPIIYSGLTSRRGYSPLFLRLAGGTELPLPPLTRKGKDLVARLHDGSHELKYSKFSIVMHRIRRLALFTAANVDWREKRRTINGSTPTRQQLTGVPKSYAEEWANDPRLPDEHQLPDAFYTNDNGAFDKGHLVRRHDVVWGNSMAEMQKANGDTYHVTNCTPQTAGFNRSQRGTDNWGDLENLVQRTTKAERSVVFSGPVLRSDDPWFSGEDVDQEIRVQIPQSYWKIVVVRGKDKRAEAYGFVVEQDLDGVGAEGLAVPSNWRSKTKSVEQIERLLEGLVDLDFLKAADQYGLENADA